MAHSTTEEPGRGDSGGRVRHGDVDAPIEERNARGNIEVRVDQLVERLPLVVFPQELGRIEQLGVEVHGGALDEKPPDQLRNLGLREPDAARARELDRAVEALIDASRV